MSGRLTPGEVARELFGIDPDRDERASQLCAETLLTLVQNGYAVPDDAENLRSPKRRQFALRSLALGENFLDAIDEGRVGGEDMSPQRYGELLAQGLDIRGSANLTLARDALKGLIDPATQQGQRGGWLLRPFHESLLWYDARRQRAKPWGVRQVYMRGSGITLARMLVAPPSKGEAQKLGPAAVRAVEHTLRESSPLAKIADRLESAMPDDGSVRLEGVELEAWNRGSDPGLATLAERLCRHAEGVMCQGTISGPARLWQLRTILALDLAIHALRTAWEVAEVPQGDRFLLLSFGGPPRRDNRVRQRSEQAYQEARQRLRQATVVTLASLMRELAAEPDVQWGDELENRRGKQDAVITQLKKLTIESESSEFARVARLATEMADFGRASEGFRVLFETVGLLTGTGQWRFISGSPDLLAALVGALSARMPMTSADFFSAMREEWDLVVAHTDGTSLSSQLDGAELERNARRAERLMSEAGLALGLSDRTVMVGERAKREGTL
jgi:hypothetical protein